MLLFLCEFNIVELRGLGVNVNKTKVSCSGMRLYSLSIKILNRYMVYGQLELKLSLLFARYATIGLKNIVLLLAVLGKKSVSANVKSIKAKSPTD